MEYKFCLISKLWSKIKVLNYVLMENKYKQKGVHMVLRIPLNADFSAQAKEIAELLDAKEAKKENQGDGKIEGSIWAKYSGTESADRISMADAEKIIASDLKERGIDFMKGLLHGMGIEWEPQKRDFDEIIKEVGGAGNKPFQKGDYPGLVNYNKEDHQGMVNKLQKE